MLHDKIKSVGKNINTNSPLLPIWLAVFWFASPMLWDKFFDAEYLFSGAKNLQDPTIAMPILLIVLSWAFLLTVPKFRTRQCILSAGSSLMTIGFFLIWYEIFHRTGGLVLFALSYGLFKSASSIEKNED